MGVLFQRFLNASHNFTPENQMARRTDHSREELEALIVKVSRNIISEQGLSQLSTRKIAAEIGYSPGTIYNVFSDLDAVISKVKH